MDSLTQIVLGAAVGELVLGKKLGNKAILLGAVAGTLPDLDVVTSFWNSDAVYRLKMHRAYSHAVFTHLLASIPLAWLSVKLSRPDRETRFSVWYLFWFLGLFTHALLDCCTTYGTRLFLPFTDYQVAFNNISVVDPLYTLPFMIFIITAMLFPRENNARSGLTWVGVGISSAYMLLTVGLKYGAHDTFHNSLPGHVKYNPKLELNSSPTILNSVLWAGIATTPDSLYVAEYSYLNRGIPVKWIAYPRHVELLSNVDCEDVKTLIWFADGQYFVEKDSAENLSFYTVKFGRANFGETEASEAFLFYFNVQINNDNYKVIANEPKMDGKMGDAFSQLKNRIGI